MPFGQPVEPEPTEKLECGCVVYRGSTDTRDALRHCAVHWAELPESERRRIRHDRRMSLLDGLFGAFLRLAMLALVAFMVWTVWRAFSQS